MEDYHVYILRSRKDRKLYIGYTRNADKRLLRHNTGQVCSTKLRKPSDLVHIETYKSKKEASEQEKYLKKLKSSEYIEKHIMCPDSSIG